MAGIAEQHLNILIATPTAITSLEAEKLINCESQRAHCTSSGIQMEINSSWKGHHCALRYTWSSRGTNDFDYHVLLPISAYYRWISGRFGGVVIMTTSSHGNIFRVTGPLRGEFTGHRWIPRTQRPVTRSFDVFFDLCLNKRLSKHSWDWWFETPSRPLWRHYNSLQFALCCDLLWLYINSHRPGLLHWHWVQSYAIMA